MTFLHIEIYSLNIKLYIFQFRFYILINRNFIPLNLWTDMFSKQFIYILSPHISLISSKVLQRKVIIIFILSSDFNYKFKTYPLVMMQ